MKQTTVYIFKDEQLQLSINNTSPDTLPLLSCRLKEVVNGEVSLTFSIPSDHPDSQIVRPGCWAVVKDPDGFFRAFMISEEKETHDENGLIREFWCEEIAISELNDEIITDIRPQQTAALDALERALTNANSRWKPGTVDSLGIGSTNFYYESVMSAIKKIIEVWGGEVRFRVTMNSRNEITGRYIDLLSRLGEKTGKRFTYSKDLLSVERRVDMKGLKTALIGRGRGEESGDGYGRRIGFADIEWSIANGDPADKPAGQEWIGDPEALEQWGHWNEDGSRRHRFGVFIWDGGPTEIEDEEQYKRDLLQATWDHLQEINKPAVTYNLDVLDLEHASSGELKHEAVRLGDSVYCIDKHFAYDVRVEARVVEIDRDLIDPAGTTLTLGNVVSDLSSLIKQIKSDLDKKVSIGDPVSWLDGYRDAANIEFEASGAYVYAKDDGEGIITTNKPINSIDDPPSMATQIKSAGIRIANSLKPNGEFDWKTIMTGDGLIADHIVSGRIRTDSVQIGDDAGLVNISGGNVTIKGGALKVYATPDASDNGVIIEGNRVMTNFVKNPEFQTIPDPDEDWILGSGMYYDSTNKCISMNSVTDTSFREVSQWIDIFHSRANFQADFSFLGGSTNPERQKARFRAQCYDASGNLISTLSKTESLIGYCKRFLLDWDVTFPPGTTRIRLYSGAMCSWGTVFADAVQLRSVSGSYDDRLNRKFLDMIPQDLLSIQTKPEIITFRQSWATESTISAGTSVNVLSFGWRKDFTPGGTVCAWVTPISTGSYRYMPSLQGISDSGATLWVTALQNIPAGSYLVNIFAYRSVIT